MPKKPIFPDLRITKAERARLAADLKSWATLNAAFLACQHTAADIRKMILVEHESGNRAHLLRRLIGRLHTTERNTYYRLLGLD